MQPGTAPTDLHRIPDATASPPSRPPSTSSGSNEQPPLTCDDWSAHGLTCEASSRWFLSFHAESRTHVPAMCPASSPMRPSGAQHGPLRPEAKFVASHAGLIRYLTWWNCPSASVGVRGGTQVKTILCEHVDCSRAHLGHPGMLPVSAGWLGRARASLSLTP
jgi:hypothetical protein